MFYRHVVALSGALFLLLGLHGARAQNLLRDGGFEFGLGTEVLVTNANYGAWTASPPSAGGSAVAAGLRASEVAPNVPGTGVLFLVGNGRITQSFPTTVGREYQVALFANGFQGRLAGASVRIFNASGNDLSSAFSVPAGGQWRLKEFSFTASGTTTFLELENVAPGIVFLDEVSVTANPLAEVTVFGTGARDPLGAGTGAGGLVTSLRQDLDSVINPGLPKTYYYSAVSSGDLVVESGNLNQVYATTDNRTDLREVTLMAETVVIRSPWRLKGTRVRIHARELRLEGAGQIVTTPNEQFPPPIDSTGPGVSGSDGDPGGTAGSVDLFIGKYTDASGNGNPKFNLNGGRGQNAGKGRHGDDGTSVPSITKYTITSDIYPDTVYTSENGYQITWLHYDGFRGESDYYGSSTLPTSGGNAWPSGRPGRGGSGGTLRTTVNGILASIGGGSPGAPGRPDARGGHTSQTVCEGGFSGTPKLAEHVLLHEQLFFRVEFESKEKFQFKDGQSFNVLTAEAGGPGRLVVDPQNPYAWMNPTLIRKVLNDIRDDYLQNRISRVQTRLDDYAGLIEQYQANVGAWNGTDPMTRLELGQMRDEMRLLRQQVANGLDYFGNPAGWVPMLSFEFSASLFDQEIDRSLDIIYLSRWIGKRQDSAVAINGALETARSRLAEEISKAQDDYGDAKKELDGLRSQAQVLQVRLTDLVNTLRVKENELHNKAVANTQPPEWETGLRLGLKIVGAGCKMIPAYQPALGAAGDGLNLASDFSPDEPWETIQQIPDVATTYLNAKAEQHAAEQAEKLTTSSLNPTDLAAHNAAGARLTKLQDLSNASSQLSAGMKNISSFLDKSRTPSTKLYAELDKLKAADPEYARVAADIEKLVTDNQDFANKIVAGIQEVAGLSDLITRDLLAMDGLSVRAGQSANLVDDRVNSYLKDMERRAWDRLLKYHYYMAKAYEYRMVRPYAAQLDLKDIFTRIEAIAGANPEASAGELPETEKDPLDKKSLHSLFRDRIADTTERIVDDFQKNSYVKGASANYRLTAGDLAALNRGESIRLNLVERKLFQPGEEDLRIRSISLDTVDDIGTTGQYDASNASVELFIEHSGLSNIRKEGKVYQFRHYSQDTRNLITWHPKYDALGRKLLQGPVNPSADSLLRALTGVGTDLILYSSPSAWADLRVWRLVNNGGAIFDLGRGEAPISLTKVNLHIEYDVILRDTGNLLSNLEVSAARTEDTQVDTASDPDAERDALTPDFQISDPDVNGRQNAQGRFLRIYNQGAPATVTVSAPERIGHLKFWKWTDNKQDVLGAGPVITVPTTNDRRLVAFYIPTYAPEYQQSFNGFVAGSGVPDGSELTSNTGVAGVVQDTAGRTYLKLTDANQGGTISQYVLQRLSPATHGFKASFDYAVFPPESGPIADGFGFYLKPPGETPDLAHNQVGGYARGLGVEFVTFGAPGYFVRVNDTRLPESFPAPIGKDPEWHHVVIRYRTAPGQGGTLSLSVDDLQLLGNVPVQYEPGSDDVFAFTARTIGFAQTTALDNVRIVPLGGPLTESANADLSGLVSSLGRMRPGFDPARTEYQVKVPNAVRSIALTPTTSDTNARVRIKGTLVVSGFPGGTIDLAEGANPIQVRVTAEDGTTVKDYFVTVTRAAAVSGNPTFAAFTGGDPGEGLDLDGIIPYAFSVGGPGTAGAVRDAVFTGDGIAGVTVTAGNESSNWAAPDYGASANDDALEAAMRSIRWSSPTSTEHPTVDVLLANLVPGTPYQLQLLFSESCCPVRAFDVLVDGELVAREFNPGGIMGGGSPSPVRGAVLAYQFTAESGVVSISLDGRLVTDPALNDHNPILSAVTLEELVNAVTPVLGVQETGGRRVVTWTHAPGFILEQTGVLSAEAEWNPVPFDLDGTTASAPLEVTDSITRFLRLRRP